MKYQKVVALKWAVILSTTYYSVEWKLCWMKSIKNLISSLLVVKGVDYMPNFIGIKEKYKHEPLRRNMTTKENHKVKEKKNYL